MNASGGSGVIHGCNLEESRKITLFRSRVLKHEQLFETICDSSSALSTSPFLGDPEEAS